MTIREWTITSQQMRLSGRNTKILEKHKLSKLIQEETENTRRPVTHKEVEFSLLKPPIRKILGPDGFTGELYQIFKEEWISTLHKHFQKKKRRRRRGRTTSPVTLYGWYYSHSSPYIRASQVALVVKNPPDNAGDTRDAGSNPGLGRSPGEGNGNPLQ